MMQCQCRAPCGINMGSLFAVSRHIQYVTCEPDGGRQMHIFLTYLYLAGPVEFREQSKDKEIQINKTWCRVSQRYTINISDILICFNLALNFYFFNSLFFKL